MVWVRVAGVDPNAFSGEGNRRFQNRIGEIVGVSGQFVLVQFSDVNDPYRHAFLPIELSMF
jgi:ribosomal protein L21E